VKLDIYIPENTYALAPVQIFYYVMKMTILVNCIIK